MDRITNKAMELGAASALDEAMDRQLDHTGGSLAYFAPEEPLDEINDDDVETVAQFTTKQAMRVAFAEEREKIRQTVLEQFEMMKQDNESEVRFSEDVVLDVDEDDLDELLDAYMEDELYGEQEFDGSDQEISGEETPSAEGIGEEVL